MEFGLKGTLRVCRGRHGEVGILEFGLDQARLLSDQRASERSKYTTRMSYTSATMYNDVFGKIFIGIIVGFGLELE